MRKGGVLHIARPWLQQAIQVTSCRFPGRGQSHQSHSHGFVSNCAFQPHRHLAARSKHCHSKQKAKYNRNEFQRRLYTAYEFDSTVMVAPTKHAPGKHVHILVHITDNSI